MALVALMAAEADRGTQARLDLSQRASRPGAWDESEIDTDVNRVFSK
jgi:hypothetical protein